MLKFIWRDLWTFLIIRPTVLLKLSQGNPLFVTCCCASLLFWVMWAEQWWRCEANKFARRSALLTYQRNHWSLKNGTRWQHIFPRFKKLERKILQVLSTLKIILKYKHLLTFNAKILSEMECQMIPKNELENVKKSFEKIWCFCYGDFPHSANKFFSFSWQNSSEKIIFTKLQPD